MGCECVGGWVLDFTRLMIISTQVEVVVEVGVELGNFEIYFCMTQGCIHKILVA